MFTSLLLAAAAMPQTGLEADAKLIPELRDALATQSADARFRVYAVFRDPLDAHALRDDVQPLERRARKRAVAERLRAHADERQREAWPLIEALQEEGQLERPLQLWVGNAIVFHGTEQAILRVAGLDDVRYVGWDPPRDPEELYDHPGPLAPPRPGMRATPPSQESGGFTTYYSTDFESGVLPPEWSAQTTGTGRVQVTSAHGPAEGSFHLVMDSSVDSSESTAVVTLQVDLSAVGTAQLRYWFKDLDDEFDSGQDVLEASDDGGLTWTKLDDLTGADGVYLTKTYDLDSFGFSYGSDFRIRWRWSDNFIAPTDGFGLDLIELADGFPPPPPPTPEPNLVQLQAPDLWALGYDGTGSLLLNIDSGTELSHPDLANRIWVNPNDPVNGIDDDGNGYIDDVNGWDFDSNDNDPNPDGSSHGTSTAGIMVGDGSGGVTLTGMAPGAQLAVARVGGETDHWAALQYGISIGVDCSSSSFSWKWYFNPKPDYHMHRMVQDMVLAAGIVHANSIGNDGTNQGSAPIPYNISAPALSPAPWRHTAQSQLGGGVSGVMACGGIELDDSQYSFSGIGPSAWEDIAVYDAFYPHGQDPAYWDYPYGGFGGNDQGLIKPDVVTYTNVVTTTTGGGYCDFGGTFAATPHLGGALALLRSTNPAAQPRHVAQALQLTAEDLGAPGKDPEYGAGKVQVLDAAKRLLHSVVAQPVNPSIGTDLNLDISGFADQQFVLGSSLDLGQTMPPFGTVDLAQPIVVLLQAQLSPSGELDVPVRIPNQPGLVGLKVHLQSVADDLSGITGQWLISTVETVTVQL